MGCECVITLEAERAIFENGLSGMINYSVCED